jgi:Protein of unknown function (DUF3040)
MIAMDMLVERYGALAGSPGCGARDVVIHFGEASGHVWRLPFAGGSTMWPGRLIVAELREGDLPTGRPGPPPLTAQKTNGYTRNYRTDARRKVFCLGRRVMPLPEDEQRQLQEIEQALDRDDPKFGRRMRAGDPRVRHKRKLIPALAGIVIGVGLLPAGAVTHRVYLQAVGVMIVLLSLVWAMASWRRHLAGIRPARSRTATTTAKDTMHRSGRTRWARMMERMEERWRRRQKGNGGMPGRTRS